MLIVRAYLLHIPQDEPSWAVLKPDVFAAIMDHFSSGDPLILDDESLAKSDTAIHPEDDEVPPQDGAGSLMRPLTQLLGMGLIL